MLLAAALFCLAASIASAAPIRYGGQSAELMVSEVAARCVRIAVVPLDEQGRARPAAPSTIFVPFKTVEKLRVREIPAAKEIRVGDLRVKIEPQPLKISVHRADGRLVQELAFNENADGGISFRTDAPVLGLGEGAGQFDRRGHAYRMLNGQVAPFLATHGGTIPVPFLIGTDGWAIMMRGPWGEFDLREGGRFLPRKEEVGKEPMELFVMGLNEPADALAEFVRLTGRPLMPPKWTLGYIQSHRTLAGPDEARQIAQTFRDKKLPCDALIYLGTGYCPAGWNTGHGSLEFNPKTFDRPAENIRALHDLNFKVVLHINHAPRNMFGASIGEVSDSPLHIRNYWARHREDFSLGVDGWWPDDGDELPIEARLARHRCYYEGPLLERPDERPWSLHRNGYAGVTRYGGWIWSGDVQSRWATLAAHVPVGVNCSLSLTPFWGTDTGGFIPTPDLTGELYTRWFQFSTFTPLFRSHGRTWKLRLPWGWNMGEPGPIESPFVPDVAELHHAEVEPICRKFLELRYRLLAYNYTLWREAADTGLPPMRALWLHYPGDAEAVKLGDEYLWGRDLLVAPVVEKGAKMRRVYLPAGRWFDWWSGERLEGGRWVERAVDLATMPIFVRAGGIVPLEPVRQFTSEPVSDPTLLRIYPGANGAFTLYDDDGKSLGYSGRADAKTIWIRMRWDDGARRLTLEPDARMKKWPGGTRTFAVEIVGNESKAKRIDFKGGRIDAKL